MQKTVNEFQPVENEFFKLDSNEQNNNYEAKDQQLIKFEVNADQAFQTQTCYIFQIKNPLFPTSPLRFKEEIQYQDFCQNKYSISEGQESQEVEDFMTTQSTANQTTKSSSSETAKKGKKKKKQRRNKNITQSNQYGNEHEKAEVLINQTKNCLEQFLKEEVKSEMIIEFSWQEQQQPDYNCEQKVVQEQTSQIQASQQQYDHNFLQTFIKNFQNQYRFKNNAGINWLISRGKEIKNSKNGNISYRQKDLKNMTKEYPETAKLGLQYLETNSKYSNQKVYNILKKLLTEKQ